MNSPRTLYPLVVVDVALFTIVDGGLRVLLVKRAEAPAARLWALPGGVLQPDQDGDLEAAARRVLHTKVSVDIPHLEEVCTFSGTSRDPRGWSIGVLFYALLPRDRIHELVRSKVEAVQWTDPSALQSTLAFDHEQQLAAAVAVLRERVERHTWPLHLLPEKFTLTELQRTCEAILGHGLDKGAFRRRLRGCADLVPIDEFVRGAQRPAQLFKAREGFRF